jgi:hypothetical protein
LGEDWECAGALAAGGTELGELLAESAVGILVEVQWEGQVPDER